jgi:hypothetical protein
MNNPNLPHYRIKQLEFMAFKYKKLAYQQLKEADSKNESLK